MSIGNVEECYDDGDGDANVFHHVSPILYVLDSQTGGYHWVSYDRTYYWGIRGAFVKTHVTLTYDVLEHLMMIFTILMKIIGIGKCSMMIDADVLRASFALVNYSDGNLHAHHSIQIAINL